jgi:hypothetical protein
MKRPLVNMPEKIRVTLLRKGGELSDISLHIKNGVKKWGQTGIFTRSLGAGLEL